MKKYRYGKTVRIGAAGGIGTPEAAMAAFMLGADFIVWLIDPVTIKSAPSINAAMAASGVPIPPAAPMRTQMNVQDTAYAPAGDMFESGSKVQVLKKGLFFPTRGLHFVINTAYTCLKILLFYLSECLFINFFN
jgi:trans-AT polyketide synthase/acyltransferase/oxidoreductase domain-containing protein